jgi:hypothetical protein
MFYEVWGLLLERADQVLRLEVRDHVGDPAARAQLDAVATLLGDLGAMWPRLYVGLQDETIVLVAGAATDPAPPASGPDPLKAYDDAVQALGDRIAAARHLPGPERERALRAVRESILGAATVQGEIVEAASVRSADRPGRRI